MNCPLCQGPGTFLTDQLRRGTGTVYHCAECDLGYLDGKPQDYNGPYRQSATPDCTTPQQIFDRYVEYQGNRLGLMRWYLRESVLEYGASAGQFLHHVDVPRKCAIEPDLDCTMFMLERGIERPRDGEKFHTVCAFQVMEHTADPVAFLKEAIGRLEPKGTLFVEVPNIHDALRSIWKIPEYEHFYFHEDHLFYFSDRSLKKAAEMAGAVRISISYQQDYTLMNHLHWLLTGRPQGTCSALGGIDLPSDNKTTAWLNGQLRALDMDYKDMLAQTGQTSNLMLIASAPPQA